MSCSRSSSRACTLSTDHISRSMTRLRSRSRRRERAGILGLRIRHGSA
jgi:hypothetical protein